MPFDFFEAVIPSFIMFLLMILFFVGLKVINKVYRTKRVEDILEDFVANSFIRFALIFYLPL